MDFREIEKRTRSIKSAETDEDDRGGGGRRRGGRRRGGEGRRRREGGRGGERGGGRGGGVVRQVAVKEIRSHKEWPGVWKLYLQEIIKHGAICKQ